MTLSVDVTSSSCVSLKMCIGIGYWPKSHVRKDMKNNSSTQAAGHERKTKIIKPARFTEGPMTDFFSKVSIQVHLAATDTGEEGKKK